MQHTQIPWFTRDYTENMVNAPRPDRMTVTFWLQSNTDDAAPEPAHTLIVALIRRARTATTRLAITKNSVSR